MTTQSQINANRQNAKKSTGPKTPEGKAAASQNSIKHGLLARSNVLSSESQQEFDLHRNLLFEELAPATPMESILTDRIVSLTWRLKRTETLQTQTFEAIDEHTNKNPLTQFTESFLPKALKKAPAEPKPDLSLGQVIFFDFSNEKVLDRLQMYERRIEKSLYKAMQELQKLKLINKINTKNESPPDHSTNKTVSTPDILSKNISESSVPSVAMKNKNMQNDLSIVAPAKMEPNSTCPARPQRSRRELAEETINKKTQNVQNEPNLQKPQKIATPYPTSNYGKFLRLQQTRNKPNSNPKHPQSEGKKPQSMKRHPQFEKSKRSKLS